MTKLSLKHINHRRLALIWSIILMLAVPMAAFAKPDDTRTYRPDLGSNSPALDIYSFRGAKSAPVVIYVHGGAWRVGKKSNVQAKPKFLNKQGYIFVSVEYRLVPNATVEQQLQDIDRALGWVADNIAKYGGDPNNLHLMGHSAGAHLVTMTGVAPQKNAAALLRSGALRSVISNDTRAYDIPRIAKVARGGKLPKLYSDVFGNKANRWQALSPIYQLRSAKTLPDFLILYSGQGDEAVRQSFATDFAAALKAKVTTARLFDGRKYTHAEINRQMGRNNDISRAVARFLKQQSR